MYFDCEQLSFTLLLDWKVGALWTRFLRKVMQTDPIAKYVERPVQPPPTHTTLEQWDEYVIHFIQLGSEQSLTQKQFLQGMDHQCLAPSRLHLHGIP